MDLSIIIVNYNVKYFLEQCLCSVQKACRNIEAEIIVVDNNSSDGSRQFLEPLFPSVSFIWNSSNAGFAKANNQAIAVARGKYILFLNPDTIVPEDCFEKCFDFFQQHPLAGALGVHMIDGSGQFLKESKRAFPSPLTSLYKLAGLSNLFPRSKTFARYYLGHLSENEDQEVDVLAGAFMMMPASVLKATGNFDEVFFMYGEDVDLSYRIQKAGFKNYYFAGTSIIHFKGESTGKGSLNYVRLFYKAMSLFVKKHYSGSKAGIFVFFVQLAIWGRAVLSAIAGLFRRRRTNLGDKRKQQIIVVGNAADLLFIKQLMDSSGIDNNILGRVSNDGNEDVLGTIEHLPSLVKKHGATEIIFCEEGLGFTKIISTLQQIPSGTNNKFHAKGSNSIVVSDSKDQMGSYVAMR